jgi:hypothetical protein
MKRWPTILIAGTFLATLVQADGNNGLDREETQRFQRNRVLIEKLVDGSLRLAAVDDPIRRADYCIDLAGPLADEIQQSLAQQEGNRVEELAGHLQALLNQGVADNLGQARQAIPVGSAEDRKLAEIHRRALAVIDQWEKRLGLEDLEPAQQTLRIIHQEKARLEQILAQGKWDRLEDKETRRQGDKETRRQGDKETRRQGDK